MGEAGGAGWSAGETNAWTSVSRKEERGERWWKYRGFSPLPTLSLSPSGDGGGYLLRPPRLSSVEWEENGLLTGFPYITH